MYVYVGKTLYTHTHTHTHIFYYIYIFNSLVTQMVKNHAIQEIWVRFLGWEDLLKKGMATHSSILAWRIPWTEESGRLQSMGV